jgi:hypothetical protein
MKNFLRYILVLICGNIPSHAQIITTVAGNGDWCTTLYGDGGPATDACIFLSPDVAVDNMGNFFIATRDHVKKVNNLGIISNFSGGGTGGDGSPATAAFLATAASVVVNGSGELWVSEYNRIRKINTLSIISTYAGTGTGGYTGDGGPATSANLHGGHLALDDTGNLYIANLYCIRKVDTFGIIRTIAGTNVPGYSGDGGPATAAEMNGVEGIALDAHNNIFFADRLNNVVRKINHVGIISTVAGTGMAGFSGDGGPATAAELNFPIGIASDPWGNLFICDRLNNRVRMVDGSGVINTIAGSGTPAFAGDGGPATAASLNRTQGIDISTTGDIYISDAQNQRIRRISTFNRAPWFTAGTIAHLTACGEYNPIDTLLRVMDSNATQPLTWSVVVPPAHGTAFVAYTTTSTGGVLTPTGTGYTPATGYQGPDTFKVRVFDGGAADTITIAVDVQLFPIAAPITGTDTICVGDMATLTGPTVGGGTGVWSSPHSTVAVGAATGVVTGMATGTATITYTLTNYCGTATATHTVTVTPAGDCPTGISSIAAGKNISIFPNPNTGTFTIQLPTGTLSHITITDVMGRRVKEFSSTASCPLSLPPGSAGIYFVAVVMGDERWYGKVLVQ